MMIFLEDARQHREVIYNIINIKKDLIMVYFYKETGSKIVFLL